VGEGIEIRSFRSVFALERRIYRIDTLRLNPSGVPLRGVAWAVGLVLAALAAGAVPPTRWLDPLLPWYARDLGFPLGLAALLASLRIDGRPFHAAARSCAEHLLNASTLSGLIPLGHGESRWAPPPILCLPDGSDARFRALRYRGPGAVLVARPHTRAEWRAPRRAGVTLHPLPGGAASRPTVLELAAGAVLEVRAH
jgi:hypothetical protein